MKLKSLTVCAVLALFVSQAAAQVSPPKTNLTRADRESWRKVLQWPDEFEDRWKSSRKYSKSESGGLSFYPLGAGKYLVAIDTWDSGYQPFYIFMYYDELSKSAKPARLLKVRRYDRDDEDGHVSSRMITEVEGVLGFGETRKELEIFSKARATGDCGSVVTYKFLRGRLVPTKARVQACYDNNALWVIDPLRWQKVRKL